MSVAYNAGMTLSADEHYMRLALEQAARAAQMGEVPIGAVVVADAGLAHGETAPGDAAGAFTCGETAAGDAAAAFACGETAGIPAAFPSGESEAGVPAGSAPEEYGAAFGAPVASACNRRETDADPAAHAEFLAVRAAARALGRWRLFDCTVYVTLEPCIMCAGLMHQARVGRCVFGAADPKAGALGTLYAVHADERLNHRFEARGGVLADESARLLRDFFARLREGR